MPPSQKNVPNWILNYILMKPHVNCKNSTNLSALRNVRIKGSFSAQLVCKSVIWTFFFLKWRHKVSEIHKCGAWSKSLHGDVFTTYWGKIESFLPKSTDRVWDVELRQWGEWERSLRSSVHLWVNKEQSLRLLAEVAEVCPGNPPPLSHHIFCFVTSVRQFRKLLIL